MDLNFEDIMLELVLRHLVPCTHVMLSQRSRVRHIDPYCRSADKFLSLAPNIKRYTLSRCNYYLLLVFILLSNYVEKEKKWLSTEI